MQDTESAFFLIRSAGAESFKGSSQGSGGIYDRVQVKQGADAFTFRDLDSYNLYGLEAAGALRYTESAIFVIRSKSFSAAHPWKLAFLGNRVDRATGQRKACRVRVQVLLFDNVLEGGRPKVVEPDAPWVRVWKNQSWQIALFALVLVAAAALK